MTEGADKGKVQTWRIRIPKNLRNKSSSNNKGRGKGRKRKDRKMW